MKIIYYKADQSKFQRLYHINGCEGRAYADLCSEYMSTETKEGPSSTNEFFEFDRHDS